METQTFNYEQAFNRNLGWLTPEEQTKLRNACVAIAGVGGAGGYQAQVLARLGVGRFKIADPDQFELSNSNRQIGASRETFGRAKTEVIREMILSINPEAEVETFDQGLVKENADAFFDSVDLVMDGIDFFCPFAKIFLFDQCYTRQITALTACPLGFGASVIIFSPNGMKFDEYFDLRKDMSEEALLMSFAFGLSPSALCMKYMDRDALDTESRRGASVAPGLMMVGAFSGTESVKILTDKWEVRACPHVYQIDLMTHRVSKKFFPLGMRGPWQRLKKDIILKFLKRKRRQG